MPPVLPRPDPVARPGSELLELLGLGGPASAAAAGWSVSGVTLDSRGVQAGDLYAALPGLKTHGARFTAAAVAAGATAILTDPAGAQIIGEAGLPVVVVPNPRERLGAVSAWVYGRPADSLLIIGITGTNGKTTTSYLVDAALRAHGHHTGVIGTVAIQIGDDVLPSARTTPEATDLHALLACMVARGVTAVTMEVSSHALVMGRVDGVRFDLAMFTNLSQDHLEFHGTLEEYFRAKSALFDPARADAALICTDDEWGRRLRSECQLPVATYGLTGNSDWSAQDLRVQPTGGTSFLVVHGGQRTDAGVAIPGEFNVANALGAVAGSVAVGIPMAQAVTAVASCTGVPGRMEPVTAGQPFLALVDYAHTPDAVERALEAVRGATDGRVITVLGAGGDRDREKRPIMGKLAAARSDILVITDDNPRSESASAIREAIMGGVKTVPEPERALTLEVAGRAAAIQEAVSRASAGDLVLVLGKGHEQGVEQAGVITPFDDRVEVRRAVLAWLGTHEKGGSQ